MLNLSDKEIDRLSREASDSYEPDDSGLSWSRLEQMLTKQLPERPPDVFRFSRFNKPFIWGPALVLITGVSVFLIKNNVNRKNFTRTDFITNQPASKDKSAQKTSNNVDSVSNLSLLPPKNDTSVSEQDLTGVLKNEKGQPIVSSGFTNRRNLGNTAAYKDGEIPKDKNTKNKNQGSAKLSAEGFVSGALISGSSKHSQRSLSMKNANGSAFHESGDQGSANQLNAGTQDDLQKSFALPDRILAASSAGIVKGNDSAMSHMAASFVKPSSRTMRLNRSLNFGLAFGPDYTDAGGISNNQIGNNIGLSLGYYVTDKISINSGIFYSNKFFWSHGYGYSPPTAPTFQQTGPSMNTAAAAYAAAPAIEYVNGSSTLYEIPLTVRYDLYNKNKMKFFVNGGMSSYIITRQTYIYFSHNGYSPVAWKTTNNSQVNYWFDVMDFSFGMEAQVAKGFSFQFEPFLRLPLKRMGMENVKMNTYGLMISFRYAPILSRSKK